MSGPRSPTKASSLLRDREPPGPRVWHLGPVGDTPGEGSLRVLVGGVGYWWQRDASFGLTVADALSVLEWPPGVRVEKLDYGAIYVALDLLQVDPPYDRLILIAGIERGREPGRLHRYRWDGALPDSEEIQRRIYEAGAGVVDLDHLLVIAQHFGALPEEVVVVELEPVDTSGGIEMSPEATERLIEAVEVARREALAPSIPPPLRDDADRYRR
jgi:hydrogenase maturation protease